METVTLKIFGMACGGCAASVKNALMAVNGVSAVDVSVENAVANVTFDPVVTSGDTFVAAVVAAGYGAELA